MRLRFAAIMLAAAVMLPTAALAARDPYKQWRKAEARLEKAERKAFAAQEKKFRRLQKEQTRKDKRQFRAMERENTKYWKRFARP
jgi:hypothetical protein